MDNRILSSVTLGGNNVRYSIIVALDNKFELTNNFIENVLKTNDFFSEGELIIILDGCIDYKTIDYLKLIEKQYNNIKIIYNISKIGYGKSNNIAVKNSNGDILVFINSDVFPKPNSIPRLVEYLEKNQDYVGAAQGLLIYPQNNKVQSTGHLFLDLQNMHVYQGKSIDDPIIYVKDTRQALTTAFCAIPRKVFFDNDMLNEYYYNAYEGFELTLKITLSGLKCMYCPEAIAYHISGGSRNKMDISETQQSKYFIHNWGKYIHTDIDKYIELQLKEDHLNRVYTEVNLSQLNGWNAIIQKLHFEINGEIRFPIGNAIDLYQAFSYSFLTFSGDYLFIIDAFSNIKNNYNWIENRMNNKDIVIDSHGNFIELGDLIK